MTHGKTKKQAMWIAPVAAIGLALALAQGAQAQTITTHVVTKADTPKTGARIVNFMDFDMNKDGMLSTSEIGDMLFKLFDSDPEATQFTAHSAFEDPNTPPDAAPRQSVEVRTIAYLDG